VSGEAKAPSIFDDLLTPPKRAQAVFVANMGIRPGAIAFLRRTPDGAELIMTSGHRHELAMDEGAFVLLAAGWWAAETGTSLPEAGKVVHDAMEAYEAVMRGES